MQDKQPTHKHTRHSQLGTQNSTAQHSTGGEPEALLSFLRLFLYLFSSLSLAAVAGALVPAERSGEVRLSTPGEIDWERINSERLAGSQQRRKKPSRKKGRRGGGRKCGACTRQREGGACAKLQYSTYSTPRMHPCRHPHLFMPALPPSNLCQLFVAARNM